MIALYTLSYFTWKKLKFYRNTNDFLLFVLYSLISFPSIIEDTQSFCISLMSFQYFMSHAVETTTSRRKIANYPWIMKLYAKVKVNEWTTVTNVGNFFIYFWLLLIVISKYYYFLTNARALTFFCTCDWMFVTNCSLFLLLVILFYPKLYTLSLKRTHMCVCEFFILSSFVFNISIRIYSFFNQIKLS